MDLKVILLMHNFCSVRPIVVKKCDYEAPDQLQKHMDEYYDFYFGGMVKAFLSNVKAKEKSNENATDANSWRWRCDPPAKHIENLTYVRFYDFETVRAQNLSVSVFKLELRVSVFIAHGYAGFCGKRAGFVDDSVLPRHV